MPCFLVLMAGLEPARYCYRGILSPLRLPISPHQQINASSILIQKRDFVNHKLEFTALSAVNSNLAH